MKTQTRTIKQFTPDIHGRFELPAGAVIQRMEPGRSGIMTVWALVDASKPLETVRITVNRVNRELVATVIDEITEAENRAVERALK